MTDRSGLLLFGKSPDEWRDIQRRQEAAEALLRRIAGLTWDQRRVRPKDEALRYFVVGPGACDGKTESIHHAEKST